MAKVDVHKAFPGVRCDTTLWLSEGAATDIERELPDRHDRGKFLAKLKEWAIAGFADREGGDNSAIRHEGDGVYRIWWKRGSLFRLVGFYTEGKREFIALAAMSKKGQKYTPGQWERIQRVAEIRKTGGWQRVEDDRA